MKPLRQFAIIPSLPIELEPLRELALNPKRTWRYERLDLSSPEIGLQCTGN